jgi:hypothetical protein
MIRKEEGRMVIIRIDEDKVTFEVQGWDKVWSLRSQLQIPLSHVKGADIDSSLIRLQVDWCESKGVAILCCPEGVLGGLADYASRPTDIAINVEAGQLRAAVTPCQ